MGSDQWNATPLEYGLVTGCVAALTYFVTIWTLSEISGSADPIWLLLRSTIMGGAMGLIFLLFRRRDGV